MMTGFGKVPRVFVMDEEVNFVNDAVLQHASRSTTADIKADLVWDLLYRFEN